MILSLKRLTILACLAACLTPTVSGAAPKPSPSPAPSRRPIPKLSARDLQKIRKLRPEVDRSAIVLDRPVDLFLAIPFASDLERSYFENSPEKGLRDFVARRLENPGFLEFSTTPAAAARKAKGNHVLVVVPAGAGTRIVVSGESNAALEKAQAIINESTPCGDADGSPGFEKACTELARKVMHELGVAFTDFTAAATTLDEGRDGTPCASFPSWLMAHDGTWLPRARVVSYDPVEDRYSDPRVDRIARYFKGGRGDSTPDSRRERRAIETEISGRLFGCGFHLSDFSKAQRLGFSLRKLDFQRAWAEEEREEALKTAGESIKRIIKSGRLEDGSVGTNPRSDLGGRSRRGEIAKHRLSDAEARAIVQELTKALQKGLAEDKTAIEICGLQEKLADRVKNCADCKDYARDAAQPFPYIEQSYCDAARASHEGKAPPALPPEVAQLLSKDLTWRAVLDGAAAIEGLLGKGPASQKIGLLLLERLAAKLPAPMWEDAALLKFVSEDWPWPANYRDRFLTLVMPRKPEVAAIVSAHPDLNVDQREQILRAVLEKSNSERAAGEARKLAECWKKAEKPGPPFKKAPCQTP